jgi:hypothetical protein
VATTYFNEDWGNVPPRMLGFISSGFVFHLPSRQDLTVGLECSVFRMKIRRLLLLKALHQDLKRWFYEGRRSR